ncbi:MAG: glycine betaine catabolism [Gammaproteobacteria bacterium]|jgi:phenylpropionate dioxygenase-like ring-hydroxylating dioxygenase large terminal subunit|nr:glycine betaine catabolism [Gammaproteobacteria bacterium]
MPSTPEIDTLGYNGLTEHTEGLPADAYFDPRRYERELQRIWYRNWVYVGRSSDLARNRAFRTFELGDQRILLVRDDQRNLQGFHNTCRHRGAALCREPEGLFGGGTIVCPYHAWTYNLHGDLLRTSSKAHADGFDVADFPLYKISVKEWNGFIFVALTHDPPPFDRMFDLPLNRLDSWSLGELAVGHVLLKTIESNWKIFWENYNECLHCPGVHPQLSPLVPIGLPSVFLVGHVDFVRVVRLLPLGPERTELRVEYLFSPQTLGDPGFDMRNVVDFTNRVMTEDAQVCELNQRGLHAGPHSRGVVMPEEYVIRQFHAWLGAELARV